MFEKVNPTSMRPAAQGTDMVEQNRQNENNRNKNNGNGSVHSTTSVVIAEPDSTTSSYSVTPTSPPSQGYFGNNVILTPCGWTSPSPQPHIVKTVNLMVNKSVKVDCTDLPLSDLETLRFFFNLGIDYFRMGCLVWPTSPTGEENMVSKPPSNGTRAITKSPEDAGKSKTIKTQKKPPRFMKLESVEAKIDKSRHGNSEEEFNDVLPEQQQQQQQQPQPQPPLPPPMPQQQIPVAIPYAPQYAVHYPAPYPVPGYPIQPVQESVPVEQAPIATVSYPDHPHYIEPPYTLPYMVYTHPQYYYPN